MFRINNYHLGRVALVLGVIIAVVWIPAITIAVRGSSQSDYSRIPTLTAPQYVEERQALMGELRSSVQKDPDSYFQSWARVNRFQAIERKFVHERPTEWSRINNGYDAGIARSDLNLLQIHYESRFGHEATARSALHMRPWVDEQQARYLMSTLPGAYRGLTFAAASAYLVTILLSLPFYGILCVRHGLRLRYEFMTGRLPFFALFGLFAVLQYPHKINPIQQAKRAIRFVASVAAGVISFAGMAATASAGERTSNEGEGGNSNVFVLNRSDLPAITGGLGIMSAKVTGNGTRVNDGLTYTANVNVAFTSGFTVNVSSTHQARGRGSNELDYTGSWSGLLPRTPAKVTIGLGLYDLNPEGTARGGDMLSPFVGVELPLGHGVTGFARADGYHLTGGAPGRDGWDGSIGVRASSRVRGVDFTHAVSTVWSQGPFHQDRGTSLRLDEAASVRLSDKLKAIFTGKMFVPLWGTRQRQCDVSVGMGLVFAY